jgi:smad nuclear-interacting protein 1
VLLLLACREVQIDAPDGLGYQRVVKPYLLDLETTNGTTINNERLDGARYYEVLSGDVIRFGFSSRDYVIMNESVV